MHENPQVAQVAVKLLTILQEQELDHASSLRTIITMLQCYCLALKIDPEDHKNMLQALVHDYSFNYEHCP